MLTICPECSGVHRRGIACPHCGKPRSRSSAVGVVLLGLTMGCMGSGGDNVDVAVSLYGPPPEDADGDGAFSGEDCDDTNPAIHPGATETKGDGVDSNCDGEDDT